MFVVYVRIIVEETSDDRWIAWFADCPQWSTGGDDPKRAIARLLKLFIRYGLEPEKIRSVTKATRTGHLEFDIPVRDRYADIVASHKSLVGLPKPSGN